MLMRMTKNTILLGSLAAAVASFSQAHTITGAGASFPYPIYANWASLYEKETGNKVNYQSIGSGGGQQQIIAQTVDFGASDDPNEGRTFTTTSIITIPCYYWSNSSGD